MRINLPVTQQNFDYPGDELLVSSTNTKGEITHCNPAFVRVSGYSYDELIGQPHNIIRHPDMPPEAYKDMLRTIGRGEPWTGLVKKPAQERRSLLGARQRHSHHGRRQAARLHVGAHQAQRGRNFCR